MIPEVIDGRVIQYNVPFASIILSKEFSLWYSLQLAKIPYENLKKIHLFWLKKSGKLLLIFIIIGKNMLDQGIMIIFIHYIFILIIIP